MDIGFDEIWVKYIMPLKGKTIYTATGKKNTIVSVEYDSIKRLSSNNLISRIDRQVFYDVYKQLIEKGSLTRDEINRATPKRCSSIVAAVFGSIPFISLIEKPKITLVLKSPNR